MNGTNLSAAVTMKEKGTKYKNFFLGVRCFVHEWWVLEKIALHLLSQSFISIRLMKMLLWTKTC